MKKILFLNIIFNLQLLALSDFEVINLKKAHQEGITGEEVRVGIIDSAFSAKHPSLKDQIIDQQFSHLNTGEIYKPDFTVDTHGTHVAGIILGKKLDEKQPYGIAYNAKMYGIQAFGYNTGNKKIIPIDIHDYFKDKNVKIINNSWNASFYPIVGLNTTYTYSSLTKQLDSKNVLDIAYRDSKTLELSKLAKQKQTLILFAAGNEGIISPGINGVLPRYDEELRSWLTIGALDSSKITKQGDIFILNGPATTQFSNGLLGVQNFSLLAPGTGINSADSNYGEEKLFGGINKNLYIKMSGTSMATPMVSGAAALVSQKFPFLNGKQIADVLLSTANKNYKAPKVILKETKGLGNKKYYTIIYIDTKAPDKSNINQIRKDLQEAGYGIFETYTALNSLIDTQPGIKPEEYNAIQSLTREDLFGQGILDIDKALGGLATLDANRLSDVDVLEYQFQDIKADKAVYYTLDTQEYITEFSNDINQRKWEENTHLKDAINKPKNLDNLNVGFIKEGLGTLTLSGDNSYLGSTIVKQGQLILKRNSDKGGTLQSPTYIEHSGKLSGNGIIYNNLYNGGIVRPGNQDLSNLIVEGKYTQTNNGILQLDFGNEKNSQLIARDYKIEGKLQYIPLPEFYTSNNAITIILGKMQPHLNDFSQVEIIGNNSFDFVAILDEDKVSINKPEQPTTPSSPSTPELSTPETQPQPTPTQPSPAPDLDTQPDSGIIIKPTLKPYAYTTSNEQLSQTLRDIRQRSDLNKDYKDYFTFLDHGDTQSTQRALKSIEGLEYLNYFSQTYNQQQINNHSNLFFALNPSFIQETNFAQNLTNNPILLASYGLSDTKLDFNLQNFQEKKHIFYMGPSFTKIYGKDYHGQSVGLNLNLGGKIDDQSQMIFNFNLTDNQIKFQMSDFQSQKFSISTNYILSLNEIKILSGINFSYYQNEMNRYLINQTNSINSNYNGFLTSTHLGLAKDFVFKNFILTPLNYLNYSYIHQDSFKENGKIFSKNYQKIDHCTLSAAIGLNANYKIILDKFDLILLNSLIYERLLKGSVIDNKVKFNDFPDNQFKQKYNLDKDFFTWNLSSQLNYPNGAFICFGVSNELTKNRYNIGLNTNLGLRF